MDILRHGNQVRVLAPDSLAERVAQQLETAATQYRNPSNAKRVPS